MNFPLFRTLLFSASLKELFRLVFATFLIVLALPFIAVLVLTRIGNETVSNRLATIEPSNNSIEIHDPTGKIIKTINQKVLWPVKGVITLEFGESDLPYQVLHTGIDIANAQGKTGDSVVSFMKGRIVYAGEISWGYGKHVIVDHGNNITSIYGHLDSINVTKDQEVDQGAVIGTEGQTGWATGPHLHFEVRVYGVPVNPMVFLGN